MNTATANGNLSEAASRPKSANSGAPSHLSRMSEARRTRLEEI